MLSEYGTASPPQASWTLEQDKKLSQQFIPQLPFHLHSETELLFWSLHLSREISWEILDASMFDFQISSFSVMTVGLKNPAVFQKVSWKEVPRCLPWLSS